MMKLPGPLRVGIVTEYDPETGRGRVRTIDNKGPKNQRKEYDFERRGHRILTIHRRSKHLLLVENKTNRPSENIDIRMEVIFLISRNSHKAYAWTGLKANAPTINEWWNIQTGRRLKREFQNRVLAFRDTDQI